MNKENYTLLLQNSNKIDALKTQQLYEVIEMYPYFQSARAVQLKGLNKTNSYKYNQELKKTAAYTIDRKVLFNFITSKIFPQNLSSKNEILEEIDIIEPESINVLPKKIITPFETKNKAQKDVQTKTEEAKEILQIGKPLNFENTEPHSFNEWMQLINKKPIERNEDTSISIKKEAKPKDKFELINKFIEKNPKIKPIDKDTVNQELTIHINTENKSLMTETLAKVYLEQKKYDNALKAYHILSLKYPEKSGFFADRIKAIKNLQKNRL